MRSRLPQAERTAGIVGAEALPPLDPGVPLAADEIAPQQPGAPVLGDAMPFARPPRIYAAPASHARPAPITKRKWRGASTFLLTASVSAAMVLASVTIPLPSLRLDRIALPALVPAAERSSVSIAEVPRPREMRQPPSRMPVAQTPRGPSDLVSVAGRSMTASAARFEPAVTQTAAAPVAVVVASVPAPVEVRRPAAARMAFLVPAPVEIFAPRVRTTPPVVVAARPLPRTDGTIVVTTGSLVLTSLQGDESIRLPRFPSPPPMARYVPRAATNGAPAAKPAWTAVWRQARVMQPSRVSFASVRDLMLIGQ